MTNIYTTSLATSHPAPLFSHKTLNSPSFHTHLHHHPHSHAIPINPHLHDQPSKHVSNLKQHHHNLDNILRKCKTVEFQDVIDDKTDWNQEKSENTISNHSDHGPKLGSTGYIETHISPRMTMTKKSRSEKEIEPTMSKNKEAFRRETLGNPLKTTEKSISSPRPRKTSENFQYSSSYFLNKPCEGSGEKRPKSPITSQAENNGGLKECVEDELMGRKTVKTASSYTTHDKTILTKKQQEIMELRRSLEEVKELRSQELLDWKEQEEILLSLIGSMNAQIGALKEQCLAHHQITKTPKAQNMSDKVHSLEKDLSHTNTLLRSLEDKNDILASEVSALQQGMCSLNNEFNCERNHLLHEIHLERSRSAAEKTKSNIFDHPISTLANQELQQLEKENAIKEECIQMMTLKTDSLVTELNSLQFLHCKNKVTEQLLCESNNNLMRYCLRKADVLHQGLEETGDSDF